MNNEAEYEQRFEAFVDQHSMRAMNYAIHLLKRHFGHEAINEAEDAVQEALWITWKHWDSIASRDVDKVVLQYLFTTLRHECFRRMKKPTPTGQVALDEVDKIMASPLPLPGSSEHLDVMELRETIAKLPDPYNRIIIGMHYENKSFEEMAAELLVSRRRMYDLHTQALKYMERVLTVGSPKPPNKRSTAQKDDEHP
jgi:RNA polymerase sigma factor (sigma-70 family)